jgi:unsaturated rhamnogalacturonyl hydrolase
MKLVLRLILISLMVVIGVNSIEAQSPSASERMAAMAMTRWQNSWASDPARPERWSYEQGVVLKGIENVWVNTGDGKYFNFIQRSIDRFVNDDGTIKTYRLDEYNIDHINQGKLLLTLYRVTEKEKYKKAADLLREQLKTHPRTNEGGFWHKKIYPYQMWLDGLYMGAPFYAEYAALFHEDAAFDDIAKQFIWMENHARDPKTGLLYHGWDESKQQRWANKQTGLSPHFWARAIGWYAMALVDTLDYFPENHPQRAALIAILNRLAVALEKYQQPKSGLWYDVVDKPTEKGNYLEASAACMFVYALAKGVRHGYLPDRYLAVAQKGYQGILAQFIKTDANGLVNLEGTVGVSGLGGNPYRDGSYQYYISEKTVTNDPKGVGAFLMASSEIDLNANRALGKGKTVTLDYYFNAETKKDITGHVVPWHYKWEERANGGYALWGHLFRSFGVMTKGLTKAPTAASLKGTHIYIIVDPDTPQEGERPNYIEPAHIKAISNWVKAGGVLVFMGNDAGNMEFYHFNQLARQFGIEFNKDSRNRVPGNEFEKGLLSVSAGDPIFKTARRLYLKEISTLSLTTPAKATFQDQRDVIMAVRKLGRGTVFAVGDPWFYNEYLDGRKLPPTFDNYQAARDLTRWLIQQVPAKRCRRRRFDGD